MNPQVSTVPKPKNSRFSLGATLVEVVITVGILVTMLLPLIGMLSLAVENSGKAVNDVVSARIASHLVGEVQQANWATLNTWDGREWHYNDQGVRLKPEQVALQSNYMARVRIEPNPLTMATQGDIPANPHEKCMIVLVSSMGGSRGKTLLDEAESALNENKPLHPRIRVSRTMVVNLEKSI